MTATPALARATEEVRQQDAAGPLMRTSVPTRTRAHAIVSAALHDPDGALAQQVAERIDASVRLLVLATGVTLAQFEEQHPGIRDSLATSAVDAVRAAILGEVSRG